MSNKNAPAAAPAPAATPTTAIDAPVATPTTAIDAPVAFATTVIRIRHVRFITKGTLIASPREAVDHLEARKSADIPVGYDIYFVETQRRFRFDRYEGGRWLVTKWIHESRIESYEEWAQPNNAE